MSANTTPVTRPDLRALAPGILSAVSFGFSNIFIKLTLLDGSDALTLGCIRGALGVLFVTIWLRHTPAQRPHSLRERRIALGIGLLFGGNLWLLFMAIRLVPVPIAILSYFVYPLLTGIVGAALGIERLRLAGVVAAVVALLGLTLLLGAHPDQLAWLGIVCAVGAGLFRVATLLTTRALLAPADSRLTTWYSMMSSTVAMIVLDGLTGAPHFVQSAMGLVGLLGVSVCSTVSILALFASTVRIGAFRTALVMNLEPVVTTVLSVLVLGELLAPLQLVGGAIMVVALCTFQIRKG
jgi:drug/metabolite transporter (DMT)-like permease